ncbi:protein WVD2-like 7 isoform X1 [Lycium barbarum]|uniref:protein WVD2-like 7 isoform X1 n=1 Tax=Lycium barbarum TaxID=112863 RepID=UPI00293E3321|nr:protein WVD2-like 7 isoform X1 [Lycium barbarum]XP_060194434.1 protein WVD2-like 7 isoform X1 [Lycium barbarum]
MMEDSACLMHAFSYASAIPNEVKQGNSVHALGESISFGRFVSESLDWEKWSTFSSHKRYVEEAERYAKPGSVAQKKAFFEAHYKKIAAQKAAALLEQQANQENPNSEITKKSSPYSVKPHVEANQEQVHKNPDSLTDSIVKASVSVADVEKRENEGSVEGPGTPEATENEPSNQIENGETQETVSGSEISETSHTEKPLLNRKQSSSSMLDDDAASVTSKKKQSAFSSFKSAVYSKKYKVPPSPARHNIPLDVDKENHFTPMTTSTNLDLTKEMRSTPKSLSKLVNFTPAIEPHKIPPPPPFIKKESSKVAPPTTEASKKCATPKTTSNGAFNRPMTTPSSESRRIKTPIHPSASGSKTPGPKWNILSSVSKSFTAYRNKLQSPTSFTPFSLRTEERAARRKQKLEEKFNAKEEKKVQQQTTLKEKAGTDLRKKLQQSFCFKARPLPEFYKETEIAKVPTKKTPVTQAQLPKRGRMPYPSSKQGLVSKPASASLTRNDSCKNPRKKTS